MSRFHNLMNQYGSYQLITKNKKLWHATDEKAISEKPEEKEAVKKENQSEKSTYHVEE